MTELRPMAGTLVNSVLIVEDEALVALSIEDVAREMGATRVVTCPDVETALCAAATGNFDLAILDLRIRGGDTHEIADRLEARGIPVVFSTGSSDAVLPERLQKHPLLSKPFADETLRSTVAEVLGMAPAAPFPRVATFPASD